MPKLSVSVVGGGIIGLTSAIRILESLDNVEVTLITKDYSPNTTADISAGFWKPYLLGDIPVDLARQWLSESYQFFVDLLKTPASGEIGLSYLSVFDFEQPKNEELLGYEQMFNYRDLTERERLAVYPDAKCGSFYTTIYAQCTRFLPYLLKRFEDNGGIVLLEEVDDLRELFAGEFDAAVNCTGISAAKLVPDPTVYPIRGQIIRVKAPWIKHATIIKGYHVLPNSDYVNIGGTAQKNDWNLNVDPEDTKRILDNCCSFVPSLKKAEVLEVNVGLRPGRLSGPRVERDLLKSADGNQIIPIIHNYGHGGSGVTLSWGCAGTVVQLLKEICKK